MLDLIILAAVAAFIASRLFKMLGKTDDDFVSKNSIDPLVQQLYKKHQKQPVADIEIVSATEAALSQNIRDVFDKIRQIDPMFNADQFCTGARSAFEMILKAFASGNKQTLQHLLGDDVYKNFAHAIDSRNANKQLLEKSIVGINSVEITEAWLDGDVATITIQIVSDQITALKDYLGNVLDGNAQMMVAHRDVWKFSRNLRKEKVWLLVGTGVF